MASFGKHLHAAQNSKLAKYTESVNFAYLSKPTPRGFDLIKGLNQKTFGTKGIISAKRTPRGLNLSKGPNQKYHRKNRKMDARKGGDVFPSEPSAPIIRSTRNKYKDEPNPSRQHRTRKGGTFFPKYKIFARCLVNRQIIYRSSIKRGETLFFS